jgi:hypothetical protein
MYGRVNITGIRYRKKQREFYANNDIIVALRTDGFIEINNTIKIEDKYLNLIIY